MLKLQSNSLDWALSHALKYGDTDVFPAAFEYRAMEHDWLSARKHLEEVDVTRWDVRPHRTLIAPKSRFAFRVVTQLDPLDFLLFAATVREIADDIETKRVPKADRIVFSYRYEQHSDGRMFDPATGYLMFLEEARRRLDRTPDVSHVATADIADFYSRIYHHRLENALQAATRRSSHVKAIMRLLSGWNNTETFGIPVGSAPARLLAEITIADVDEALLANGITFLRFNDDYRVFARSHAEAYRALAFLADVLFKNHGLTLQQHKTQVLPVEDFARRFLATPMSRELDSLRARFEQLMGVLGLANPYEPIDYDELDEAQFGSYCADLASSTTPRSSTSYSVIWIAYIQPSQTWSAICKVFAAYRRSSGKGSGRESLIS